MSRLRRASGRLVLAVAAVLAPGCRSQAEALPAPAASARARPAAPAGSVVLVEAPESGDVEPIVRDAMAKAAGEKRKLVVYVGATWCEPCQRFHAAAARGELDSLFPDLTLVAFDATRDAERLASAGYASRLIPLFALPSPDGTSSGTQIEGGIKGDGAVGDIAPRLRGLIGP